jgi:hypothetical protein
MCLFVTIKFDGLDRSQVTELVSNLLPEVKLEIRVPRKRWFGRDELYLSLSEDGGCACGFLTDDADWNAATWAMEPNIRPKLAATIRAIGKAVSCSMTFEAIWGGKVTQTLEVELEQLAQLAENSRLGTTTRYNVVGRH